MCACVCFLCTWVFVYGCLHLTVYEVCKCVCMCSVYVILPVLRGGAEACGGLWMWYTLHLESVCWDEGSSVAPQMLGLLPPQQHSPLTWGSLQPGSAVLIVKAGGSAFCTPPRMGQHRPHSVPSLPDLKSVGYSFLSILLGRRDESEMTKDSKSLFRSLIWPRKKR